VELILAVQGKIKIGGKKFWWIFIETAKPHSVQRSWKW